MSAASNAIRNFDASLNADELDHAGIAAHADTWHNLAKAAADEIEAGEKERRRVGTLDMRLRRVVRMLRKILSDEVLKELEAGLTDE